MILIIWDRKKLIPKKKLVLGMDMGWVPKKIGFWVWVELGLADAEIYVIIIIIMISVKRVRRT